MGVGPGRGSQRFLKHDAWLCEGRTGAAVDTVDPYYAEVNIPDGRYFEGFDFELEVRVQSPDYLVDSAGGV